MLLAAACAGAFLFSGCRSNRDPKQVADVIASIRAAGGPLQLLAATTEFRSQNNRWPKDYTELSVFVQQKGGRLRLPSDQVELVNLPGDFFVMRWVVQGQTNQMELGPDSIKKIK
jgi:hypothetical protein